MLFRSLRERGIPTVVWLSPILPFINDTPENLQGLLGYCTATQVKGIVCFGFGMTLREGDREYYYSKLNQHFPGLRERYIQQYGYAYELLSDHHAALMNTLTQTCQAHGILCDQREVFEYMHRFETPQRATQTSLF